MGDVCYVLVNTRTKMVHAIAPGFTLGTLCGLHDVQILRAKRGLGWRYKPNLRVNCLECLAEEGAQVK